MPLEKGKVVDRVECASDPVFTYAVYLPSTYSENSKLPLILAFDPHGSGNLPVTLYKDLAEKYGFILTGSNNSKNGQDGNITMSAIHAMMDEVKSRFSIDTNRIYTMGFSGGARVAVMAAFFPAGIAGVTGSGAGFPNSGSAFPLSFDYLGMAGTSDFNMYEMLQLDEYLDKSATHHALILFDGIHQWPDVEIMENAFLWNDLCAMRKKTLVIQNKEIEVFKKVQDEKIRQANESADPLSLNRELKNMIRFLDQLIDLKTYRQQLDQLEKSGDYRNALALEKKDQEKEMEEQHFLNENFFSKDTTWWKKKLAGWDQVISGGKKKNEVMMTKRLKSYLSLVCYMNYTRALEAREAAASAHAMKIYEMVDPEHAAQTKK